MPGSGVSSGLFILRHSLHSHIQAPRSAQRVSSQKSKSQPLMCLDSVAERGLAENFLITPNELRKYMGTLHVHRLVKRLVGINQVMRLTKRRYVNKERTTMQEWKKPGAPPLVDGQLRTRDVIYWYLDYREFANVTKYRLAMMRKDIDEKIKQVGFTR